MALITDPDDISVTTDIVITTGATPTIQLKSTGSIDSYDGITLQCVYSWCMKNWGNSLYIPYDFPFIAITDEQFILIKDWDWADAATRNLIRNAGWAVLKKGEIYHQQRWMNITTLGTFEDPTEDVAYYNQTGSTTTDFANYGPVNQAVQFYYDSDSNGTPDYDYKDSFHIYLRERHSDIPATFDDYDLIKEQNISVLTYKKYALPLSSKEDINISASDATIASSSPYTSMSITWLAGSHRGTWTTSTVYNAGDSVEDETTAGSFWYTVAGGTSTNASRATDGGVTWTQSTTGASPLRSLNNIVYPFHIIIEGNEGTKQEIYEFVQYSLRSTGDIDANTGGHIGEVAEEMLEFIGDTLKTKFTTFGGVFVDGYLPAEINEYVFLDDAEEERIFPLFVSVGLSGVTEGTSVLIIANETVGTITAGDIILQSFANSSGSASVSFSYEVAFDPSGLDVIVRARNQGIACAAIADDGGSMTDETAEASSNATGDMTLLPSSPAANDAYYFGHTEQFNKLKINISTALIFSVQPTITWEYYNGTWVSLSNVEDATDGFEISGFGVISYIMPIDWITVSVNSQGPYYYIRARLSTAGTITQAPIGATVQLDTTRYLPYTAERTITSTGLADIATWTKDTISQIT